MAVETPLWQLQWVRTSKALRPPTLIPATHCLTSMGRHLQPTSPAVSLAKGALHGLYTSLETGLWLEILHHAHWIGISTAGQQTLRDAPRPTKFFGIQSLANITFFPSLNSNSKQQLKCPPKGSMPIGGLPNVWTATWRKAENEPEEVTFSLPCPYLDKNREEVPI